MKTLHKIAIAASAAALAAALALRPWREAPAHSAKEVPPAAEPEPARQNRAAPAVRSGEVLDRGVLEAMNEASLTAEFVEAISAPRLDSSSREAMIKSVKEMTDALEPAERVRFQAAGMRLFVDAVMAYPARDKLVIDPSSATEEEKAAAKFHWDNIVDGLSRRLEGMDAAEITELGEKQAKGKPPAQEEFRKFLESGKKGTVQ